MNNNNEFVKRKPLHYCSLVKSFYEQLTALEQLHLKLTIECSARYILMLYAHYPFVLDTWQDGV